MKISELPEAPQWLLDAKTEDASVEWGNGVGSWIIWCCGTWLGGEWRGGKWLGGKWHGGTWLGGTWVGGKWLGGKWHGGTWLGGTWVGGKWLGGAWHGGTWDGGTWRGGTWDGGTWYGGTWHDGVSAVRSKYIPMVTDCGKIQIGCKEKTIAEWDLWFAGGEEYDTERGTEQFAMIEAHYKATKAYVEHMEAFRAQ